MEYLEQNHIRDTLQPVQSANGVQSLLDLGHILAEIDSHLLLELLLDHQGLAGAVEQES